MKIVKGLLLTFSVALATNSAFSIPARQNLRTVVQPDGTELRIRTIGDENLHLTVTEEGRILHLDSDGYYRLGQINPEGIIVSTGIKPSEDIECKAGINISEIDLTGLRAERIEKGLSPQSGLDMKRRASAVSGSPRVPVFLVEYTDVKFSTDFDVKDYFTRMMTEEDFSMFGGTGSAMQYFAEQSKGKFTPTFDVYGPVTLPENQAFYGGNYGQGWDPKAHYMVSHAAKALNSEIDFSLYDSDNDGYVDFVYVFYAGQGEHNQGGPDSVWPHAGNLNSVADFVLVDGKWLNKYACSNEMEGDIPNGLGPVIHEYSHILGLPDLYADTSVVEDRDFTPGPYSVLDYGVYNNDSRTPPNYTAYERMMLKWDTPMMLDHAMTVTLDNISTGESGIIPTSRSTEYFLLENRQLEGWDAALPSHGMLIWHIDENIRPQGLYVNPDRDHQMVDLIEANEIAAFAKYADGYTFPGTTGKTAFTAETSPAFVTTDGSPVDLPVTGIKEENGMISFDIAGGNQDIPTGIDSITENDLMPQYFNLQGLPVERPLPGSIVIEKRGENVRKIRI